MTLVVNDYKDGFSFSGAAADQTGFTLLGGKYQFVAVDTGTINCTLEVLGPDGTTYVAVNTAGTAYAVYDLGPGKYKVVLGTGTSLSVSLTKIPYSQR